MKLLLTAFTLAVALVITGIRVDAQSGEDLFQKALATERADGNLQEAIRLYERVARQFPADRPLVARALVRIADCHERLGQREAIKVYERVVREFPEQSDSAIVARARLAALAVPPSSPPRPVARQIWSGPDAASPTPSPEGRFLVFTSWTTGDLAIRDLVSGTDRLVTRTGGWQASGDYADVASVSPDGRFIAYSWYVERDRRYELRILPSSATPAVQPRTIFRGESTRDYMVPHDWTADGRQLLVSRFVALQTRQLALVSIADGRTRILKTLARPTVTRAALSPDGRFIAYDALSGDGGGPDIFIMGADGSSDRPVVAGASADRAPVWSADGTRLLFLSNRTGANALWSLAVREGQPAASPQLVKSDLGGSLLGSSKTGTLFYALPGANRRNIHVAEMNEDIKSVGETRLGVDTFVNGNHGPSWSPNGEQLAYLSSRPSLRLVVRTVADGREQVVPVALPLRSAFNSGPDWFPDNRSVLVTADDPETGGLRFFRVEVSTGAARLVHRTGQSPSFDLSPDGTGLFYVDRVNDSSTERWRLVRFDLESGRESVILENDWFISLAVSPDGQHVAYVRSLRPSDTVRGFPTSLHVVPASGGTPTQIFETSGENWGGARYNALTWSPTQRHLLFVLDGTNEAIPNTLWRVPVTGGAPERVGIDVAGRLKNPRFHPDGRRLAFAIVETGASEVWALDNVGLAPR